MRSNFDAWAKSILSILLLMVMIALVVASAVAAAVLIVLGQPRAAVPIVLLFFFSARLLRWLVVPLLPAEVGGRIKVEQDPLLSRLCDVLTAIHKKKS